MSRERAVGLLLKRLAFEHESEVRLICVKGATSLDPLAHMRVSIDPNEVFDEATYEPRLEIFERKEREATALRWGFKGPFRESMLYQQVLLSIDPPDQA